ncbi:hypothetical protein [Leisingera caerulea]|uniref:hypothetical protein n=1 Tax=Leisingera caerulea TaxID=506591 RepID=UPI0012B5551F|nr:hypothetical protein [Leisingera caerulea]
MTIHNAEQPGTPAHFEVSHMISASSEQNGLLTRNTFHWTTLLPADSNALPYIRVEDEAAHQIAGALRELADAVEADVERADAERAQRAEED